MRPSEFEAIRPHLQEAFDDIDADLKRRQSLENDAELHDSFNRLAALPKGTPPKVKLRKLSQEEAKQFHGSACSVPRIEDAYPWRHSAARAAVDLRDCGWIKEAAAIGEALSGLPTGPVDGNRPENMARQFDTIREGAERIRTILTACLAGGPNPEGGKSDDAGTVHSLADQNGTRDDQSGGPVESSNETKRRAGCRRPKAMPSERKCWQHSGSIPVSKMMSASWPVWWA